MTCHDQLDVTLQVFVTRKARCDHLSSTESLDESPSKDDQIKSPTDLFFISVLQGWSPAGPTCAFCPGSSVGVRQSLGAHWRRDGVGTQMSWAAVLCELMLICGFHVSSGTRAL